MTGPPPPQWQPQYLPPQPPQPPQAPPVTSRPSSGIGKWLIPLIVGVLALVAGIAIGYAAGSSNKSPAASGVFPTSTSVPTVTASGSRPAPSVSVSTFVSTASGAASSSQLVVTLSGTNDRQSPQFTVPHDVWSVTYSYDCSASVVGQGKFAFGVYNQQGKLDPSKPGVSETSTKNSATVTERGTGTYYVAISSQCPWTVTIAG